MYAPFFGLRHEPFSIAPDPRYLFMSERHREALAHLLYGVDGGGGFVLLSGEIGTGKTTVCRCFLEQIPGNCNVAYIFNPKLTAAELLQTICGEFRVAVPHEGSGAPTAKAFIDALNAFLLQSHAQGRNNLLVIDEAQNLNADVLEQLRLLTNLETSERKLLQIVLIGQPELRNMLACPELEQLAQRVIARFHLDALSPQETSQYIRHRLSTAGLTGPLPFDAQALRRIHQRTRGVPRRINLLCGRALLGAYASGQPRVGRAIVEQAAREVFGPSATATAAGAARRVRRAIGPWTLGLLCGAALAGLGAYALRASPPESSGGVRAETAVAPKSAPPPTAAVSAPASGAVAKTTPLRAFTRSEAEAWRALAAAWRFDPESHADPCQSVQRQQAQCFRGNRVSLALIRQLDRPGFLTLYDASQQPAYALLTGLDERQATLSFGDTTQTLTLAALAGLWRGDFATYWRMPPGYLHWRREANDTGNPFGHWLAQQLQADPAAASAPPDASLRRRLHAFQLAHGLAPDGRLGPITLMQLNRAAGVDEPRLLSRTQPPAR